ncbi:hydroxymethylglutaryl-coenzyme A reductase-domain-containing protein [Aspergillus pseudoustus]|uniref:3-hydroxy-3-methylglutaryl coenzyme A reductase n=1 Tax=Aspergillus pseudoustus TaxID=1810923 RepID=A0ABR4KD79_9EURO
MASSSSGASKKRAAQRVAKTSPPNSNWFKNIASLPQKLPWISSLHPVHTIVLVSLLVSSAYVSLLENSLLDCDRHGNTRLCSSVGKGKQFYAGPGTEWKWYTLPSSAQLGPEIDHRAIVNLEFPGSSPLPFVSWPGDLDVDALDQSTFSVPHHKLDEFLGLVRDLNVQSADASTEATNTWIMKPQAQPRMSLSGLFRDEFAELVHRFKIASPLDVLTMAAAYIAMHLTFASLFMSMYRMGSRFWLATSVLVSSTFAFLFGLLTTRKLGVPVEVGVLSEGLPFLVITIGFENPIKLTQAVLSHARKPADRATNAGKDTATSAIPTCIESAIQQEAPAIVKNYLVEIAVLLAGSLLSTDSALRQFCFLAAWILFFDCVLLFSFYTSILCIKLEILRLQKSGSGQTQSATATGKDLSRTTLFAQWVSPSRLRKFKLGMIAAFVLVNALNMAVLPLRSVTGPASVPKAHRTQGHSVDLATSASGSLETILGHAISTGQKTLVTVLPPIRFELAHNVAWDATETPSGYGMSSLLKSLEDPVLSKCIITALVISVILNGRLFSVARKGRQDSTTISRSDVSRSKAAPAHRKEQPQPEEQPQEAQARGQHELESAIQLALTSTLSPRALTDCQALLRDGQASELTDEELVALSLNGNLPLHALEKTLKDFTRAVKVRRAIISRSKATTTLTQSLASSELPYEQYDWSRVFGVCCENVVGYMPVPLGMAGPLVIDKQSYFLPMATTEGVLVAGVMRGSKAINAGGGVTTVLTADGMTRGPCVTFESLERTAEAKRWLDSLDGQNVMKTAFNSTTRYGRLESMKTVMAGTNLYIRFKASTGDAMGMNMISKGVEHALETMRGVAGFQDMDIVSLSANYCSDKKPAAINWIDGRGKSVVAQATIPAEIVKSVLKTDVESMVALNVDKNLIGSAMAGSIGGFNAHAANIVAAMYIATGQDPAQVVESANCITIMKNVRGSLQISVSMPSMEVGTIGGGTTLGPQRAMLDMLGVRGPNYENPGENARQLARIIAAGVLATELSLCAALAAGHLVKAHMQHNRAPAAQPAN